MKHTFESIIKAIYDGYDILEIDSSDVVLTKYIVHLFNEYHIDITRSDIKQSFLNRLKDSTHQIWVDLYVKRILCNVVNDYHLPGRHFIKHQHYFSPDKSLSEFGPSDYKGNVFLLQDLYHDFKKGNYRYDFCVHDIICSKQLYNAFHMCQKYLTPQNLDYLINLMYRDIIAFENHDIIRIYLKNVAEQDEYYHDVLGSSNDTNNLHLYYYPGDPELEESIFDFDQIKKASKQRYRLKTTCTNVMMDEQDLMIQQMKHILMNIKQYHWFNESFLVKQHRQSSLNVLLRQYKLNELNIPSKEDILNQSQPNEFYMSRGNTDYNCDTQRDYEKDQRAVSLLYAIQTVCNKDPEPYRHLLYLMYGSDSDIIKIGRTMNGSDRVGLYEAPINQNDSHFNNDEVVMLLGFDYSYGVYKPYNNYKNGLTLGTAKFFTAEYILKQLLYSYCERSLYIEKFEKGKEWFRFKQNVSDINKAKVVRLIEKLIVKANKVVEAASDNCMSVTEVKKEIEYDEKRDINKWLNEILMD